MKAPVQPGRIVMLIYFHRIRQFHRFLAGQALYPMLLSSGLAVGLFAGRVYLGHTLTYIFLVWNLFLAWMPYLSSLWAAHHHRRHPRRWWSLLIPGALWLIFFPNAPYILTDFLHLRARAPIPIWYDIGMLATFAWTGLFLAVFSLRTMQTLVKSFAGSLVSWLFALTSLGLAGLGIYMGRFLRWNSWDLLFQPRSVLTDLAIRLTNPWDHPGTFGVTLLFAAFLSICYLTFTAIPVREHLSGGTSTEQT
jgi:uncharacterized membrane protein